MIRPQVPIRCRDTEPARQGTSAAESDARLSNLDGGRPVCFAQDLIEAAFEHSVDGGRSHPLLGSRLHDFGFRGCTSVEQVPAGRVTRRSPILASHS